MTSIQPRTADVPAANAFWTRYSPNGEAVFSPMASVVIHGLVLAVLLLGVVGWLQSTKQPDSTVELEPVGGDGQPSGGGDPRGVGNVPNELGRNDVAENLTDKIHVPATPETDPAVKGPAAISLPADPDGLSRSRPTAKQSANTQVGLSDSIPGISPRGHKGDGAGFDQGPGPGGRRTFRDERAARWEMFFRTETHADYLRQLRGVGAYIGIPDVNGRLMIVKNLNERPAKWQYESVRELDRVYWHDSRPESARGIAELFGMQVVPSMFVAFIPRSIEDQLAKIEMEYAAKYKVTKESDIKETQFNVSFRGGKPVFTVKAQTRRPTVKD